MLVCAGLLALAAPGRPGWTVAAVAWWSLLALVAAFVDGAVHRLPNTLTYPAAAGTTLLLTLAAAVGGEWDRLGRALGIGVGVAVLFLLVTLAAGGRHLGMGDAKFAVSTFMIIGWLGWPHILLGLLAAFGLQLLWGVGLMVAGRADRHRGIPLGPFLFIAAVGLWLLYG
ncbi:A24 family peptidase [Phytomonospora sp. NPDC050363]|uniref:A24 family peptidase n=1 Tax=Phytomonospora sp. NPDC050363 TaxID=3155642 RepID=UPI0033F91729